METNKTTPTETTQQPITNKKMMNCKTCGAPMAKNAKKCQTCGAKNPKKRIKKLVALLIILAIIVGYPAFFIIRDNTSATITARNNETFHYTKFKNIYSEYMANDNYDEFINEYLPAEVVVKGKITEIDKTSIGVSNDGLGVHVESGACNIIKIEINNNYVYMISYDLYTNAEEYDFGNLKVGDKVVATGFITNSITLKDGNYIAETLPLKLEIIGTQNGIVKT